MKHIYSYFRYINWHGDLFALQCQHDINISIHMQIIQLRKDPNCTDKRVRAVLRKSSRQRSSMVDRFLVSVQQAKDENNRLRAFLQQANDYFSSTFTLLVTSTNC